VVVHPTNIFALAAIAVSLKKKVSGTVSGRKGRCQVPALRRKRFLTPFFLAAVALAALALWAGFMVKASSPGGLRANLHDLLHTHSGSHWALLYADLFSGQTVYQYLAGSDSWLCWPGWGGAVRTLAGLGLPWAALVAAAIYLWRRKAAAGNAPATPEQIADRALVLAWLLELAGFLVLAGPRGMVPGQERYALCLVVPAVLLLSRALAKFVGWALPTGVPAAPVKPLTPVGNAHPTLRVAVIVLAVAAGWFFLADCRQHYFRFIEQTGGMAHRTFRTAAVEPKLAALNYILEHRRPGETWIVADEYWTYWPLQYLALEHKDVRVELIAEASGRKIRTSPDLSRAAAAGRLWRVRFQASRRGRPPQTHEIPDFSGQPVLWVTREQ
jgi:hypothetical protein